MESLKTLKRFLPTGLLISGCILLTLSLMTEGAAITLFIIFPVFSGAGPLFILSVILLIAGFLTLPLLFARSGEVVYMASGKHEKEIIQDTDARLREKNSVRAGGIIFIGPIPILVASDARTAFYTAIIALFFIIGLLLLLVF